MMHLRDLLELGDAPGLEKFLIAAKKRHDATISRHWPEQ
jgi:hypothetical protein